MNDFLGNLEGFRQSCEINCYIVDEMITNAKAAKGEAKKARGETEGSEAAIKVNENVHFGAKLDFLFDFRYNFYVLKIKDRKMSFIP